MRRDEPRRPWHGSQPGLKRTPFGLANTIGIRNAHCRTDDGIARAEHLNEVRPRRPPCVNVSAEWYVCLSALQMFVVSEGQHFPSPTLTRHDIRKIVGHKRIADGESTGIA